MRTFVHAIRKMESDGRFGSAEEIPGAYYLSKWSFITITTIDGDEVDIAKDGSNAPTNIILDHGYIILEYL